jgi:anti-sigma factor RsiW
MTGMAGCREIKQALGVYVLGAIDPAERAQVEEHLATCADCREELASLAGLPAMLRKVPVIEAERLAAAEQEPEFADVPSSEMLPSLVARTANVRRIRRWRGLAAAAAVALVAVAGGAAVTSALQSSGSSPPGNAQPATWHQTTGAGPAPDAHLTVQYRNEPWGTQMRVNVTGLRPGSVCQFRVTDKAGGKSVVGSWVSWQGTAWYPASTWLAENELRAFQVTINGHLVASAPVT